MPFDNGQPADAMPSNVEAEQAFLGCLLYENAVLHDAEGLEARHFYEPLHATIYEAARSLIAKDGRAEPIGVMERLRGDGRLAEMGGVRYLADLVTRAPSTPMAAGFAQIIVDLATRRDVIRFAQGLSRAAIEDNAAPISEILVDAERSVEAMARGAALPDKSLVSAVDATTARLEEMADAVARGRPKGAQTGLRCFDRRMGGLQPGWLVTIGGRPSMGKSALMRAAAFGCARHNPDSKVVIFSMEMPRGELIDRALSELSDDDGPGIPYFLMAQDKIGELDLHRLRGLRSMIPTNLVIDDTPALSLDDIRRRTWALRRKHKIAAVFVDYLQKMPLRYGSSRNDSALYGEITGGLHQLARQAETCVVLLSQLNRMVEHRDNKRPALADLKESGSIEADSNAVFFPFREAYYLERNEPVAGSVEHAKWVTALELVKRRLEVICAKTRQGPIGTDVQVYFAEYDKIIDEGRS